MNSGEESSGDALQDMCANLMQQIRDSDWLEQNPPKGESIFVQETTPKDANTTPTEKSGWSDVSAVT